MTDDSPAADRSAGIVMAAAEAKPKCVRHPHRVASARIQGAAYRPECEQMEPGYMKRTYLAVLLAALLLPGCLRRPAPESTEMQRYYESLRLLDITAMSDTLEQIDGLNEAGYRADLGQRLQAAAVAARQELSAADAALSAEGYAPDKARSLLERRIREASDVR